MANVVNLAPKETGKNTPDGKKILRIDIAKKTVYLIETDDGLVEYNPEVQDIDISASEKVVSLAQKIIPVSKDTAIGFHKIKEVGGGGRVYFKISWWTLFHRSAKVALEKGSNKGWSQAKGLPVTDPEIFKQYIEWVDANKEPEEAK